MSTKYKYHALADELRRQIESGKYPLGEKLPTESAMMDMYGLSRQTVRQALSRLEIEGIIQKRRGSGSVVCERPVSAARGNERKTIAVITTYINEYIFPDILRAIEEVLAENDYLTVLFATKNRVDNERKILSSILEQPVDGLIVEGTKTALPNPNIDMYNALEQRGVPVVFIHAAYPELHSAIKVVTDDKAGGMIAVEHLIANGHRNIAGIFKSDDIQGHLRYAGYIEAMREHGLPISDDNVLWYSTESKDTVCEQVGTLSSDCTAILCYNDEVAFRLLSSLNQSGIAVPDRISIMSFDNSSHSELTTPKISSCSQRKYQVGLLAAKKVIGLIGGIPQEPSILEWRVVEKESVRKLN